MNLYNFHAKPKLLDGYDSVPENNPHFFWEKYKNNPAELKKREKYIAKSANYAYLYAGDVLNGPFPAGESEIAKDVYYAYWYAADILGAPFPLGEEAISKNALYARWYARDVLEKDFYLDDKLIAKAE